ITLEPGYSGAITRAIARRPGGSTNGLPGAAKTTGTRVSGPTEPQGPGARWQQPPAADATATERHGTDSVRGSLRDPAPGTSPQVGTAKGDAASFQPFAGARAPPTGHKRPT